MDRKVDFMANLKEIDVTVKRYDPEKDSFFDQVYHVKVEIGKVSVINVLDMIAENIDPSLAFYGPCHIGKCGGCLMTINGKAAYACATLVEGDLLLGPGPGRKVLVDLVASCND